ncbi:MAG: tetratricopeptide repeat protein [Acidobacteria bacterium]|nr:tetratricopeptide repeat protein [Acidobacteriota bacterium]
MPCVFIFLALLAGQAQAPESVEAALEAAYRALREKSYDAAVAGFRRAIEAAPERAALRKDLAYTLLKIGENEAARDQFAEAARIDPGDHHAALEYAFLCFETGKPAEARRIFDRIRRAGDPASQKTAAEAFDRIDGPLGASIERWLEVARRG